MTRAGPVVVGLSLLLLACGSASDGDSPTTPTGGATLHIISGSNAADTVLSALAEVLTLEVRVGGAVRAGVAVRFEAVPMPGRIPQQFWVRFLRSSDPLSAQGIVSDTTDAAGRVKVKIQLGGSAGDVLAAVNVPAYGLSDTARFTVLPGKPTQILHAPLDTALSQGATYALSAASADRFGNRRGDPLDLVPLSNVTSMTTSGIVTTEGVGRGRVVARLGTLTDTVRFTVVPPGRAMFLYATNRIGSDYQIASARLDGREFRVWVSRTDPYTQTATRVPGTDLAVLNMADFNRRYEVRLIDSTGTGRTIVDANLVDFPRETHPTLDGRYVFFTGGLLNENWHDVVFRVRVDGSKIDTLAGPSNSFWLPRYHVTPSPDGSRFAFVEGDTSLILQDAANGQRRVLATRASYPAYAPDGSRIVYVANGRFVLVDLATGARSFVGSQSGSAPAWSPDGRWILSGSSTGIMVTDVVTGDQFIIPRTEGWSNISLAP